MHRGAFCLQRTRPICSVHTNKSLNWKEKVSVIMLVCACARVRASVSSCINTNTYKPFIRKAFTLHEKKKCIQSLKQQRFWPHLYQIHRCDWLMFWARGMGEWGSEISLVPRVTCWANSNCALLISRVVDGGSHQLISIVLKWPGWEWMINPVSSLPGNCYTQIDSSHYRYSPHHHHQSSSSVLSFMVHQNQNKQT